MAGIYFIKRCIANEKFYIFCIDLFNFEESVAGNLNLYPNDQALNDRSDVYSVFIGLVVETFKVNVCIMVVRFRYACAPAFHPFCNEIVRVSIIAVWIKSVESRNMHEFIPFASIFVALITF